MLNLQMNIGELKARSGLYCKRTLTKLSHQLRVTDVCQLGKASASTTFGHDPADLGAGNFHRKECARSYN